jgi:preprotein translocase subunit YajC
MFLASLSFVIMFLALVLGIFFLSIRPSTMRTLKGEIAKKQLDNDDRLIRKRRGTSAA